MKVHEFSLAFLRYDTLMYLSPDSVMIDFRFLTRLRSLCLQVTTLGPQGAVPHLLHQLSLVQSNSLEYITFSVKDVHVFIFNKPQEVKARWGVVDSILTAPSFHRFRRVEILAMDWPFLGQHAEMFHGLCEKGVEICVDSQ